MYYIRATGSNKFTGDGTSRWLKIRNFAKYPGHGYEIAVQIQGRTKFVNVSEKNCENVEFAEGWPDLMPVSLSRIIKYYYG